MPDSPLDSILARPVLRPRERILVLCMAALCRKDGKTLRRLGPSCEAAGISGNELRELCLQGLLFAGFPRALTAYEELLPWLGEDHVRHVDTETPFDEGRRRGEELFGLIYGDVASRVHDKLEALDPAALEYVLGFAYGRVLTRPDLDLSTRELLAVSALSALDQGPQLLGHARGALHAGATREEVIEAAESVAALYPEIMALGHGELLRSFLHDAEHDRDR
jgi:4-carboxymuconolactone decarboxylase